MILDPIPAADCIARVRTNPVNAALLDRLPVLGLPDCWLVAGCLFQTIWNVQSGHPAAAQISDYDVFYCDPTDLSYEAEDGAIQRLKSAFADLEAVVELKNQARVHLWYQQRFGHAYPALQSSTDGIDRFLVLHLRRHFLQPRSAAARLCQPRPRRHVCGSPTPQPAQPSQQPLPRKIPQLPIPLALAVGRLILGLAVDLARLRVCLLRRHLPLSMQRAEIFLRF
jgi:hypothetical protein